MLDLKETAITVEIVLAGGEGQCSGYLPVVQGISDDGSAAFGTKGRYMEIWKYRKFIYMVVDASGTNNLSKWELIPLGPDWTQR